MSVTHYQCLQEVKQEIIDYVDLTGVNGTEDLLDANIYIWSAPVLNTHKERYKSSLSEVPAIVIAPSRTVEYIPGSGTNLHSDVKLPVLIQICDREISVDEDDKIHSWLKWSQGIRQHFHEGDLRNQVFNSDGYLNYVEVGHIDILEERLFGVHHQMVQYVPIICHSREPHNTSGIV